MFDRIKYWGQQRTTLMARLNGTGNNFILTDVDFLPSRKWNLAEISSIRIPPEFQFVRLDDDRGVFPNPERAYLQFTGLALEGPSDIPGGNAILFDDGRLWDMKQSPYAGMQGVTNRWKWRWQGTRTIEYGVEQVIHARFRPGWQPADTGYGVSAQCGSGTSYNIVHGGLQDLANGRMLETLDPTVHEFPQESNEELFKEYQKRLEEMQPQPGRHYAIKGGKIYKASSPNSQMSQIDDVWLQIGILSLALGYPLVLKGLGAERMNGLLLQRIEEVLKRTIRIQNQIEEYEIIRPLAWRQLFYSGKADVPFEIKFPAATLEDENRKSKRIISEIQTQILSRQAGMRMLHQMDEPQVGEMLREIEEEIEKLGPPGHYQPGPENADKGKKGVETVDPENQDISPTEGTGSE
jgi:hypothetical protein